MKTWIVKWETDGAKYEAKFQDKRYAQQWAASRRIRGGINITITEA